MADTIEIVQGTATTVEIAGPTGPQGPAGSNGAAGSNGEAATISIGTVTTGAAGSSASVTNTGTSSAAVLAFAIPRGDKGDKGDTGSTGPAGTTDYNNLTNKPTGFPSLRIDPANGNVGSLVVGNTTSGQNDYVTIDDKVRLKSSTNSFKASIDAAALSADRTATLPNASGTLALTSDIPSTFAASAITSGTLDTARLGSGTASSGTWLRGDSTWQALPSSIGGSTGSTDNAVLRADGTGGSTAQASGIVIDDYTSSTQGNITIAPRAVSFSCTATASDDFVTATGHTFANGDQVTFTALTGGGGLSTNIRYFVRDSEANKFKVATTVSGSAVNITTDATAGTVQLIAALVLTPRNVSAFIVGPKPDGTSSGGNARGLRAIELCLSRTNAINVASGDDTVGIGTMIYAPTAHGVAIGTSANSSGGDGSVSIGKNNIASGIYSVALGKDNQAAAAATVATGIGALSDRISMRAHRAAGFTGVGDNQAVEFISIGKTTNNTATELFTNGSSTRITIPSGKVISGIAHILGVKSDGTAVAQYIREFCAKNVAGTSSLVGTVTTVGTDVEDNASTDVSVTVSDANDAVQISVTGITGETWRWIASVDAVEVAYGT